MRDEFFSRLVRMWDRFWEFSDRIPVHVGIAIYFTLGVGPLWHLSLWPLLRLAVWLTTEPVPIRLISLEAINVFLRFLIAWPIWALIIVWGYVIYRRFRSK